VHGIGQQRRGEAVLLKDWWPAMSDGLSRAEADGLVVRSQVATAYYGDLFRPPGRFLAAGDPPYTAADVEDGFEQELLAAWWQSAADCDPAVVPPDLAGSLAAVPRSVQAGLLALSGSKFFANVALRAMVADLKQVRAYLLDEQIRAAVRARIDALITDETRVVVAHSLGSVAAYEALCARAGHKVRALVTLGSPLGIPNLVFHRLRPAPSGHGGPLHGAWPGGEDLVWTNLADSGDVVALAKDLRPRFGRRVRCAVVDNGAHAHSAVPYLTDRLCGEAIAAGLADRGYQSPMIPAS
jgi:hypothetical protein